MVLCHEISSFKKDTLDCQKTNQFRCGLLVKQGAKSNESTWFIFHKIYSFKKRALDCQNKTINFSVVKQGTKSKTWFLFIQKTRSRLQNTCTLSEVVL